MKHSEIKELFERKLTEACKSISTAKNGDKLSIRKSISYIDDRLVEKQSYNGKENTSIVASALIFEKGADSDEDPSYEISLLCDLKDGFVKNPAELEKELSNFDTELARFLCALSENEDISALIREEDERIKLEGEKMVAELEASLAKMKKAGIIGGILLFGIMLLFALLK